MHSNTAGLIRITILLLICERRIMTEAKNPLGYTAIYDDKAHTYKVKETNTYLTGVTAFISNFIPEFNAEYWAKKKASDLGTTEEKIKKKWENKAQKARDIGHLVHLYAHCKLNKKKSIPNPTCQRSEQLFKRIDESISYLSNFFFFVCSEMIVFSPSLGLAGTIDLVMQHKKSKNYILLDWKQNAKITSSNTWQQCLPPIKHLDSCDTVKYGLQLSFYKKILDHEQYFPGAKISQLGLIHLVEDCQAINIPIKYMGSEIERILKKKNDL